MASVTQAAERAALNKLIDYLDNNPEKHIPQIMDLVNKAVPDSVFPTQRAVIGSAIKEHSNWYELIMRAFRLNRGCAHNPGDLVISGDGYDLPSRSCK